MFPIPRKCTRSPYSLRSSSHFSTNNIFFTISLYLPSPVIWLFFLWLCCYWIACIIHMYKYATILIASTPMISSSILPNGDPAPKGRKRKCHVDTCKNFTVGNSTGSPEWPKVRTQTSRVPTDTLRWFLRAEWVGKLHIHIYLSLAGS